MIKGPGLGRDAALRAIRRSGILLSFVRDITPMPHNGCRPPKKDVYSIKVPQRAGTAWGGTYHAPKMAAWHPLLRANLFLRGNPDANNKLLLLVTSGNSSFSFLSCRQGLSIAPWRSVVESI
ncbi:30S ribosomal protein S11, chloroplastic, partial [Ananas comosus]